MPCIEVVLVIITLIEGILGYFSPKKIYIPIKAPPLTIIYVDQEIINFGNNQT